MPKLAELDAQLCQQQERAPFTGVLFCLDPGSTTGWAVYDRCLLTNSGQWDTPDAPTFGRLLKNVINVYTPYTVICEDYRVYKWKTDQHAGAHLHEPRIIGVAEYICSELNIPFVAQMAHQAKHFCTDDKLREWGMYTKGKKHARDAIRHGVYYILFGRHTNV